MKYLISKNNMDTYDVIVIGGGAAGMMAAGRAAELGKRVLILEKNPKVGEKLKITGGGRCNITNAEEDTRALLKHYGAAEQFLYSPFSQFGMPETFAFFEKLSLPLVVQARKRAFPKTERAADVVRALEKYLRQGKVTVKTDSKVSRIVIENGSVSHVLAGKEKYTAVSYIMATGGYSHPETGSTGDGFKWLKALGHSAVDPTPTLVPLSVKERWVHELSGVSLTFMKISFFLKGKKQFSKTGKLLFTHFGLSGPLILNAAGAVGELLDNGPVTAVIDAYPDTDLGALEDKIIAVFDANKNKILKNVLDQIVPHGMTGIFATLLPHLSLETKVHSVTKAERRRIAETLKSLSMTITGLMGYDRAVVADGGIPLEEIDMKTMRSKVVKNLYLTGDLLDIHRPSGGYSLQLCWTTGFVAGSNA
jgi:predicted Rossmann fold flavoprotein